MKTKTIEIKGFIHASLASDGSNTAFMFSTSKDLGFLDSVYTTHMLVQPHTLVAEVKDVSLDFRAARVSALEKEKVTLRADMQKRITQINEEISKLQAIEFTPAEVVA